MKTLDIYTIGFYFKILFQTVYRTQKSRDQSDDHYKIDAQTCTRFRESIRRNLLYKKENKISPISLAEFLQNIVVANFIGHRAHVNLFF